MAVRFICSKCGFQANVKDELAGKRIKCRQCQAVSVVGAAAKRRPAKKPVPEDDENPFANLGDPAKFGTTIEEDDEDWELAESEEQRKVRRRAERAVAKKRKKKKPEDGINTGVLMLVLVGVLAVAGGAGFGLYSFAPNLFAAAKIEAPKEFEKTHHLFGEFYVELPKGWDKELSENKPGVGAWLKCKARSDVRIEIREDEFGSIIAKTTAMGGNAQEMSQIFGAAGAAEAKVNPSDPAIVRTVHDRAKAKFEPNYSSYSEGPTEPVRTKYGDGRICEVSFQEGFTKMKALRATVFDGDRSYTVFAQCPESNFETLKPAFQKIVESFEDVLPPGM